MELNLYVMDIRELENADLFAQALCLLDPARKEKAMRAKNEKDRARLAGAGLLLLLAHAGLNGSMRLTDGDIFCGKSMSDFDLKQVQKEREKEDIVSEESLQMLTPTLIIQTIVDEGEKRGHPLSEGIFYEISDRGRPDWRLSTGQEEVSRAAAGIKSDQIAKEREVAAYPYFNLSHSGYYAALAAGNLPVGIDIQEPREIRHPSIGDYRSFSRLESYLKCTGQGFAHRIETCYQELEEAENSGGYCFWNLHMPDQYALWICADLRHSTERFSHTLF